MPKPEAGDTYTGKKSRAALHFKKPGYVIMLGSKPFHKILESVVINIFDLQSHHEAMCSTLPFNYALKCVHFRKYFLNMQNYMAQQLVFLSNPEKLA